MNLKRIWLLPIMLVAALMLAACPAAGVPSGAVVEGGEVEIEAGEVVEGDVTTGEVIETAPTGGEEIGLEAVNWAEIDPSGQTITFWHQHSQEREEALLQIIQEFNETNEYGITVNAEYQGGYGDIFNKMLNVLNTQDAPNLVVAYQNQAATYQLADALVDLTPLVESEEWGIPEEDQQDFFTGFWEADIFPTFDDARLGFPPNRSMEVLYYNQDWLAELGYEGPPTTPEEFREMACAATEQPFSGATGEGSIGYQLGISASTLASWTFAFGGDIFDYENDEYTYDSEAAIEAMQFLQSLFEEGCATLVTEEFGDQTDFGLGTLLFSTGSSSGLPFYRAAISEGADFAWSVAPIPHTTEDPVMNVYGASVSIPKAPPEEVLATWIFLKYYTNPEVQAEWARASNYFPVRQSVAEGLDEYFQEDPAYQTAFDLLRFGKTEPPVPGYDFVRDLVDESMAAIVDGADVVETLTALDEEADAILEEQMMGLE